MDELVKRAMDKWPNVPDCYGWLGLDARGRWFMRDDSAQHEGQFQSGIAKAKGAELKHEKLIEFIGRNYAADDTGQWFFQNGPQRVFVELQTTPWIWRLENDYSVVSHTGKLAQLKEAYTDENGLLYFDTSVGFGLVHSQDIYRAGEAIEEMHWRVIETNAKDLIQKFQYVLSPETLHIKRQKKASI